MKRIRLLGAPMDVLSMEETTSLIRERIMGGVFTQHVVVNVAKIVNMRNNLALAKSVVECDIINIDGMGVVWGGRFLGHDIKERVAGVDLFHRLNAMAEKERFPVYYLGAEEFVVAKTSKIMAKLHPELLLAGYHHGYFWDNEKEVVDDIRKSGARLLFVAIMSPKKEIFIDKWKKDLGVDFVMGVGGTFDVVAGKVQRAPVWMQRYGLEWLFRVIQEPRRMWRRYLVTNFKFVWLVLVSKFGRI